MYNTSLNEYGAAASTVTNFVGPADLSMEELESASGGLWPLAIVLLLGGCATSGSVKGSCTTGDGGTSCSVEGEIRW